MLKKITSLTGEIVLESFEIAAKLHELKELSLKEYKSVEVQKNYLKAKGFITQTNQGGLETAFVSFYDKASEDNFFHVKERKIIALLSEYDALPELGHACGHNLIAAVSAGTFALLSCFKQDFKHDLVLIGTPGEEHGGGKVTMVNNGYFDKVDGALMIHPSNKTRVSVRMLNIKDIFISFYGKDSHAAASPEKGINALDAVVQLFNSVNAYRQQMPEGCMIHGIITDGGKAPNIIPGFAQAHFCIRGLEDKDFSLLEQKFIACAEGAAQQTGCRLEIEYGKMNYKSFNPSLEYAGIYQEALKEMGLEESKCGKKEGMYSSDIGNVSHVCPSLHVELKLAEDIYWHSSGFADAVMKYGKKYLQQAITLNALSIYKILTQL
ncbi:MAG: amidohydrolase [Nitrospinae bacterium]|nr:amidohydrolase [Nitrospinota bacterium]